MPKQKIAVRDKFYTLAKEQGYRARSAFKLIQLNRKYGILDDASRAIDLCAAPGGWLQVCAKVMPPRPDRQIIGVDLLPIKPLRGVVTFQADITTPECRRIIRHELKGNQADVVLCDGAPNVGSAYGKDAYVQSELALAALRFATDHLRRGGCFITKAFRSADYNALIWAFQQLFRKVEATKPTSSRNVSAEIFVVCRDYIAPDKIDPKLLDPKFVFAQVEPGANDKESKLPVSLLLGDDKKNAQKKFRAGYEDGSTLGYKRTRAIDFITSEDPVRELTENSELTFGDGADDEKESIMLEHPGTTQEVKSLCQDIKVLGKSDFKHLLKWRMAVLKDLKKLKGEDEMDGDEDKTSKKPSGGDDDKEDDEIELGKALLDLEESRKKEEKRVRKQHAKLQRYKDQGLIHPYAIDVAEMEGSFSLKSLGVSSTKDPRLDLFRDVDSSAPIDSERPSRKEDDEEDDEEEEEEENYSDLIEKQLEFDYERYQRRQTLNEPMTVQERRRQLTAEKKAKMKKSTLERMTEEDFQRALEEAKEDAYQKGLYAKMLRKGNLPADEQSSSEDDDEDEEGQDDLEEDEEEAKPKETSLDKQARIAKARAERWFQQQVFNDANIDDDDDNDDDDLDPNAIPLPRETMDKEKRRLKRKKEEDRKEKKRAKKEQKDQKAAAADGVAERRAMSKLEIVPADDDVERNGEDYDFDLDDAREETNRRRNVDPKIKTLIEKGMGKKKFEREGENQRIQVVSANDTGRKRITRDFDDDEDSGSDEENLVEGYNSEDYDSDERAQHLALGAMLAKKSTRNSVLDAAYNRYAYNDDALPAWFAEDESKHNRPNLPITKEMIESVKARFSDMNDRPIKKVAEARMRKRKRAIKKLDDAKRKAAAIVDEPDLSGRSKVRAIEKLFKGAQIKRPGSVYAVSSKGGAQRTSGGKSTKGKKVKVVDPRLKKDMRGGKDKKGKKGGGKRNKRR